MRTDNGHAAVDFNPRSPCGERRDDAGFFHFRYSISTHAPRAGSDPPSVVGSVTMPNFNPRSPCGERPVEDHEDDAGKIHFNPRSPCGERPRQSWHSRKPSEFQPTLPVRGATATVATIKSRSTFQPTLPVRGAPGRCRCAGRTTRFQPTLPVRGATHTSCAVDQTPCHFNPRSPCGERHGRAWPWRAAL